jgi:hypothetical protein
MAGGECEGGLNHFTKCFAARAAEAALFVAPRKIPWIEEALADAGGCPSTP